MRAPLVALAAAPVAALVVSLAMPAGAVAQSVSLGGSLGSHALLVIDGKARNVAVGSTVDGVRLVSVSSSDAVVEVKGQRVTLLLGGSPANLGGAASAGSGRRIVISAGSGGHFFTTGLINGQTVNFVVDTGATTIALSEAEADRLGLDYKKGRISYSSTANGMVVAHRVSLSSVRIGDVQVYNVAATVLPTPLPIVLLGNSFLERFQMRRENDLLTLDKRY